jgi:two-component system cell cycle response regulator
VLSSLQSEEDKLKILESGARDFISKPVIPRELLARVSILLENKQLIDRLEAQKRLLFALAMRDQLTSLFNRRSLFEIAPKEVASAQRHGYPISLFMLDLDHFKEVNDNYGHQAGDSVLREIGALILSLLREGDFAARFGGEEFVVLLPHCKMSDAMARAEDLRAAIEGQNPASLPVTTSIGVATLAPGWNFEALFRAADEAVYRAKANGRNRVERDGIEGDE